MHWLSVSVKCVVQADVWFKPTAPAAAAAAAADSADDDQINTDQPQTLDHDQAEGQSQTDGQQDQQTSEAGTSAMIDRVSCLRPVLFDLFADHTVDPPMLNYVDMVMLRRPYDSLYTCVLRKT